MNNKIEAKLRIQRVLYNGTSYDGSPYTVLSCSVVESEEEIPTNKYGTISVCGSGLEDLKVGNSYDLEIRLDTKAKYPNSYIGNQKYAEIPKDAVGQWKFLSNVLTDNQFYDFQKAFSSDEKIIDIILNNKALIIENVKGIGESTYEKLYQKIGKFESLGKVFQLFDGYTITKHQMTAIATHYNHNQQRIKDNVENNFFDFVKVSGLGFKIIDKIYLSNPKNSKESDMRILSGIMYSIEEAVHNGDTKISYKDMINNSLKNLNVKRSLIENIFNENKINASKITNSFFATPDFYLKNNTIVEKDGYVTLSELYCKELFIYQNILERMKIKPTLKDCNLQELFKTFKQETNIELSDEQKQFFLDMFDNSIQFLVANGGTGKSMSQTFLKRYAQETNQKILFLAPTGKARNKLEEYVEQQAFTVHKALGFPTGNGINLDLYDMVLVDESSMLDVELTYHLLQSLHLNTKVFFIGDDAQIPSVSCGNFLFDCTHEMENKVKISKFTKVFRQEEGGILDIITKTRKGEKFISYDFVGRKRFGSNCVVKNRLEFGQDYSDLAVNDYIRVIQEGGWNVEDVILITPTKKGYNGTFEINSRIQEVLNPESIDKEEITINNGDNSYILRVGDIVMNTKNDTMKVYQYTNGLYMSTGESSQIANGDNGVIHYINNDEIFVKIGDEFYKFSKADAKKLIHAWAITGHKSQGSEYKVVIALIPRQSAYQMNGNLLYTMMSRAKEYLLIVGDSRIINNSLKKYENFERNTNLRDFFVTEK